MPPTPTFDKAHANLDEHNRKLAGFQKQLDRRRI